MPVAFVIILRLVSPRRQLRLLIFSLTPYASQPILLKAFHAAIAGCVTLLLPYFAAAELIRRYMIFSVVPSPAFRPRDQLFHVFVPPRR